MGLEDKGLIDEIYWSQVYNSTIAGSKWLKDKSVSPGRWAVGYNYLYVLYRILNDVKPENIMEMGLGQSTRVIAQYAACYKAHHIVFEENKDWTEFFSLGFDGLSEYTQIKHCDIKRELFKNENVPVYEGFKDFLNEDRKKYQLFSIDAPIQGSDNFSRIDVLNCIPNNLGDDFVMMFDDCGWNIHANTIIEVKKALDSHGIKYTSSVYSGYDWKKVVVIASEGWSFLTTL